MKRVLVFCGASPGRLPEYAERGYEFGRQIAARGLEVVYGGASVGMMGAVADGALAAGGNVIGVIPRGLLEHEIAHAGITRLEVVDTMHERKALMSNLADAVAALPGGTGTLDELFELFTWSQLGLHDKPLGLLDVADYWQPLLRFLRHAVAERFLPGDHLETLLVERDGDVLLDRLAAHKPEMRDRWLDRRYTTQAVPNSSQAVPNSSQAVPNSSQAVPNSDQAVPNSDQAVPKGDQAVPNSDQAVPKGDQGVPNSDQAVPNTRSPASPKPGRM